MTAIIQKLRSALDKEQRYAYIGRGDSEVQFVYQPVITRYQEDSSLAQDGMPVSEPLEATKPTFGSVAANQTPQEELTNVLGSADEAVVELTAQRSVHSSGRAGLQIFEPRGLSAFHFKPQPYPETELFWERFNVGRRVDGGAIEICANFNLTHGLPLARTGWSPDKVRLVKLEENFDARQVLADPKFIAAFQQSERDREMKGKSRILDPITHKPLTRNGIKFTIVRVSPNVDERDDLTVALRETDYVTIMQALPGASNYPEKRRCYGNADPVLNQIPNAMAVEFISLFEDGNVLAILRDSDLDYDPGTWSFSGEEQFKDTDLDAEDSARTERFLLRSVVEEVFPLAGARDDQELQRRLAYVAPTVRSMRIWSVFIEEANVSFVLFAVFELGLTVESYRRLVNNLRLSGCQLSGEGRYHTVELRDAVRLLDGQTIAATPLFGTGHELLSPDALHPTSRYRLGLLLEVLSASAK